MKKVYRLSMFIVLFFVTVLGITAYAPHTAVTAPEQMGTWSKKLAGNFGIMQRLSFAAEDDGWLVQFDQSNTAFLARYSREGNPIAMWRPFNSVTHSQTIVRSDIVMTSATDGWLVLGGGLGSEDATSSIYRWNGDSWNFFTTVTAPNAISLSALDALAANNVYALGGGKFWSQLYRWDGSAWNFVAQTPGGVWVDALDMLNDNDGWAVGLNGNIAHWNGSEWTAVASSTSNTLQAIDMIDSNTGWAVGDNGEIQAWGGTAWATYPSPTTANLTGIDMVSADEGWIVGQGVVLHWDGTQWQTVSLPESDFFYDVEMLSAKNGWMIGNNSIWQYQVKEPKLNLSENSGAPGSYFNVLGQDFTPNTTAEITVNGRVLGNVSVGSSGSFAFTLTTAEADEGTYVLSAANESTSVTRFFIDNDAPVRPENNPAELIAVPAGIALTESIFLSLIVR